MGEAGQAGLSSQMAALLAELPVASPGHQPAARSTGPGYLAEPLTDRELESCGCSPQASPTSASPTS